MKLLNTGRVAALFSLLLAFSLSACRMHKHTAKSERKTKEVYASLKNTLGTAEVTLLKDSIRVLFPKNLMFEFNKAEVRPELNPSLQQFAGVLQQYRNTKILIIGRTDSVGGDRTNNQQLSERRADSARAVIHYYGVKDRRMEHWGVGAKDPIATNGTEEGRAKNRSVEFIVLINN